MGGVLIHDIVSFCSKYLKVNEFEDFCTNGLQVEGALQVNTIVCGVSLSELLIKNTIKHKAQMLLVHHGIFDNQLGKHIRICGVMKQRISLILKHNINLVGYHLPLDAHPKIGNNYSLCKLLGLRNLKPFDVGFIGELPCLEFKKFVNKVNFKLNTNSYVLPFGPTKIKRVAVVCGAASSLVERVIACGADVFLTGDIKESLVRFCEEAKLNFINAGHYNTEKLGVQNLAQLISNKFNIPYHFVDIPCDI